MLRRSLALPGRPAGSFFLWGPRQAGKSSLLRTTYPDARVVDLLLTDVYLRFLQQPALLRDELRDAPGVRSPCSTRSRRCRRCSTRCTG